MGLSRGHHHLLSPMIPGATDVIPLFSPRPRTLCWDTLASGGRCTRGRKNLGEHRKEDGAAGNNQVEEEDKKREETAPSKETSGSRGAVNKCFPLGRTHGAHQQCMDYSVLSPRPPVSNVG